VLDEPGGGLIGRFRRRRHDPLAQDFIEGPLVANPTGTPSGGFFYFLLLLSVVSLIVIGLLVYAAVVKTYFSG
jgi:hypothetical protein